jgi:hypothetical protein
MSPLPPPQCDGTFTASLARPSEGVANNTTDAVWDMLGVGSLGIGVLLATATLGQGVAFEFSRAEKLQRNHQALDTGGTRR